MNTSTKDSLNPCTIKETFDLHNITAVSGANMFIDFMNSLEINEHLEGLSVRKAHWADYSVGLELQLLIAGYALGFSRIEHMETLRDDPLLVEKFELERLPHKSNTYRLLDRFDDQAKIDELATDINNPLLQSIIDVKEPIIVDMDSTVNTVYGAQEGTSIGYNPRYRGRASYQPLIAFDGTSKAALNVVLRDGATPSGTEVVDFLQETKKCLPDGITIDYFRGDKGFCGDEILTRLEQGEINYAIKLKMTSKVIERIERGILWSRVYGYDNCAIEVGSARVKLTSWDEPRRIVLIRETEFNNHGQLRLFDLWDYQAIVTNLDWPALDIWQFYNQRATCENYIKELKYGLNITSSSKNNFFANAADLWLKIISYNILLALKMHAPEECRSWSAKKIQRLLLRIPGLLVRHARKLTLRLPRWWPYKHVWSTLRRSIATLK